MSIQGASRWDFIQSQRSKGKRLYDIAPELGLTYGSLRAWIHKNKDRYPSINQSINKPVTTKNDDINEDNQIIYPTIEQQELDFETFCLDAFGITFYVYQKDWIVFLDKHQKVMLLAPRFHGKSFLIYLHCIFYLVKHYPYGTVLFLTTAALARRAFKTIHAPFERNKVIHNILHTTNPVMFKNRSTKDMNFSHDLITITDPSLQVAGRVGEVIGSHAKRIYIEDIIQSEPKTQHAYDTLVEWYDAAISYIESLEGQTIITGTRKGAGDIYQHIMSKNEHEMYVAKALKLNPAFPEAHWPSYNDFVWVNNKPLECKLPAEWFITLGCPEYPLSRLLNKFYTDPEIFEREMQNNIIPSTGLYFSPKDIQYYEDLPRTISTVLSIHCDPSFGMGPTADFTAVVVVGWDKSMDRFYILDHVIKRNLKYDDIINTYIDTVVKWTEKGYVFVNYSMESNFTQQWLVDGLKRAPYPITGIKSRTNKIERISSLGPAFKQRLFYFNRVNPDFNEALNQIANWNQTDSTARKKDDFLDALHSAYTQIGVVLYKARGKAYAIA